MLVSQIGEDMFSRKNDHKINYPIPLNNVVTIKLVQLKSIYLKRYSCTCIFTFRNRDNVNNCYSQLFNIFILSYLDFFCTPMRKLQEEK